MRLPWRDVLELEQNIESSASQPATKQPDSYILWIYEMLYLCIASKAMICSIISSMTRPLDSNSNSNSNTHFHTSEVLVILSYSHPLAVALVWCYCGSRNKGKAQNILSLCSRSNNCPSGRRVKFAIHYYLCKYVSNKQIRIIRPHQVRYLRAHYDNTAETHMLGG